MVKITVLYGTPTDPEAFEHHYSNTHVPLVGKLPNLRRFEASRVIGAGDGGPPPFYRMAELWFDSPDEMQATLSSPEGQATTGDIPNFASGGATVLISDVDG